MMDEVISGLVYGGSRWVGLILAPLLLRFHCLNFRKVPRGPYILACNHISHFDPPLLVTAFPRRIDFMTMIELFQHPVVRWWLRQVRAFPVDREGKDTRAVRVAIQRLRAGHIVGLFPEGGLRTGPASVLGGAELPLSVATLAQLASCPVRTCLVIGTDQLYVQRQWWQRPHIYFVFGEELVSRADLPKAEARAELTQRVRDSWRRLYAGLQDAGKITPDLVPRPARERWAEEVERLRRTLPSVPSSPL